MCLVRSAAALAGALLISATLWGAEGGPRAAPSSKADSSYSSAAAQSVVVLDVARVFKNHLRFKQRMDAIRREVDRYDKEVSAEQQEIVARGAKVKDFKSGSAEYKKIEEQAARELADLRIRHFARKRAFFDREGKIYYDTYQEIVAVVSRLAQLHDISLVLRYNSDETDPLDRGSILKAINREVVFQSHLDITTLVIEHVNGLNVATAQKRALK